MVRECLKCGGSKYKDYAYGCEHDFGDPPTPSYVSLCWESSGQWLGVEHHYYATGMIDEQCVEASHPTYEGVIALWKERYRWAGFINALFTTLSRWSKEGGELAAKRALASYRPMKALGWRRAERPLSEYDLD